MNVGATAAIAVMKWKERDVRDAFHSAGAINPAAAMSLDAIGIEETRAVRRLEKRSVIREAAPGLFYFDEDVWVATRSQRRRMGLLLAGTVVLVLLLVLYGTMSLQ
jgi:hypothetical protein